MRLFPAVRAVAIAGSMVLLGASLATQFGGTSVEAATMQTRTASCTGLDFHPIESATEYGHYNFELVRTQTTGDGYFYCHLDLPTRAVVTKVQFTLEDTTAGGAVDYCGLFRNDLDPAHVGEYQQVAQVPSTGDNAVPRTVRYSTTAITYGTIDNSRYAYWAQCRINEEPFHDNDLGIYGATVTYKISAANG
jgi:hypothetical protein